MILRIGTKKKNHRLGLFILRDKIGSRDKQACEPLNSRWSSPLPMDTRNPKKVISVFPAAARVWYLTCQATPFS
ncbi:hypothetical protein EVAR_96086_1 [Eumeta japonica]|uniref:Uncharacterized protein n=1 Tax=Eumeta variegata TaxID=151549 RepID=A0A4C1VE68_EUMVA|nr:hypothetical protein EVAR_96086_1 [Eumeta japonica]